MHVIEITVISDTLEAPGRTSIVVNLIVHPNQGSTSHN